MIRFHGSASGIRGRRTDQRNIKAPQRNHPAVRLYYSCVLRGSTGSQPPAALRPSPIRHSLNPMTPGAAVSPTNRSRC